jgi:hypothetical protein
MIHYRNSFLLQVLEYSPGQILDVYNIIRNYPEHFHDYVRVYGLPTNVNLPYLMLSLNRHELIEQFMCEYSMECDGIEKEHILQGVLLSGNLELFKTLHNNDFFELNQSVFNLACDKSNLVTVRYIFMKGKNINITDENIKRSAIFNNIDVSNYLLGELIESKKIHLDRFKYIYSFAINENSKRLIDVALTSGIPFPVGIESKEDLLYSAILHKSPSVIKLLINKYNTWPNFGNNDCLKKAIEMRLVNVVDILLQWHIKTNTPVKLLEDLELGELETNVNTINPIIDIECVLDLISFDYIESACYIFYLYNLHNINLNFTEEILSLTDIHTAEELKTNYIGYVIMQYAKNNIQIQPTTQNALFSQNIISKLISVGGLDSAIYYNLKCNYNICFDTIMSGINNYTKLKSLSKKSIIDEFFHKLKQIIGTDESKKYKQCLDILPFQDMESILVQFF